MIVDDEPSSIKLAQECLRRAGYRQFVTTSESVHAMSLLRAESPDIVLLDTIMPRVSGLDILGAIREDEALGQKAATNVKSREQLEF